MEISSNLAVGIKTSIEKLHFHLNKSNFDFVSKFLLYRNIWGSELIFEHDHNGEFGNKLNAYIYKNFNFEFFFDKTKINYHNFNFFLCDIKINERDLYKNSISYIPTDTINSLDIYEETYEFKEGKHANFLNSNKIENIIKDSKKCANYISKCPEAFEIGLINMLRIRIV